MSLSLLCAYAIGVPLCVGHAPPALATGAVGAVIRLQISPQAVRPGMGQLRIGPFPNRLGRMRLGEVFVDFPDGAIRGLRARGAPLVSFVQPKKGSVSRVLLSFPRRQGTRKAEIALEQICSPREGGPQTLLAFSSAKLGDASVIAGPYILRPRQRRLQRQQLLCPPAVADLTRTMTEELVLQTGTRDLRSMMNAEVEDRFDRVREELDTNFVVEDATNTAWGRITNLPWAFSLAPQVQRKTGLRPEKTTPQLRVFDNGLLVGSMFPGEFRSGD